MAKKTTGKAQESIGAPSTTNGNGNGNATARPENAGIGMESRDGTISTEEIAARAYEIYEREGRGDGRDMDHWLQAENELRAERQNRGTNPETRQDSPRSARQLQQSPGV